MSGPAGTKTEAARPPAHPNVVVRKRRRPGGHDEHHGGAWKVAYADFVTAMMAFFLVMWLVNQKPAVKESVGGYFRDPVAFAEGGGGSGLLEGGEKVALVKGPEAEPEPDPGGKDEIQARKEQLLERAREILQELSRVPALQELAGQIELELTEDGLRMQLMESEKSTFFGVGSAALSPEGIQIVQAIAHMIGPLDYDVALEGHTDSRPYASTNGYTNWELSADRANAARKLLEESGVGASRIKAVSGYADMRLRWAELPEDPRNRRVAIVMLNPDAAAVSATSRPEPVATQPLGDPTHPPVPSPAG